MKKKPKLEHLRTFGSIAYVRIPDPMLHKLSLRGRKVLFLGYEITTKNYRLYDLETRSIMKSRDVHFAEENNHEEDEEVVCFDEGKTKKVYDDVDRNNDAVTEIENKDSDEDKQIDDDSEYDRSASSSSDDASPINSKSQLTTRSGRTIRLPDKFSDYVSVGSTLLTTDKVTEPSTYKAAIESNEKQLWVDSMKSEIDNLLKNATWTIVDRPIHKNVIGCKWVYRLERK